jgi:hypothetical protein
MMWTYTREELPNGRGVRFTVGYDTRPMKPLTFAEVVQGWRKDAAFRGWWHALMRSVPFPAFRWETPGVSAATFSRDFEFVALDAPDLAQHPDRDAFAEHFAKSKGVAGVVTFPNLRGDALLVVPCPVGEAPFGHLAEFLREAPQPQTHALWRAVGQAMAKRVKAKTPVWLSTAGAGVSWLHVRLDDRPKYYGHEPYRKPPG